MPYQPLSHLRQYDITEETINWGAETHTKKASSGVMLFFSDNKQFCGQSLNTVINIVSYPETVFKE